MEIKLEVYYPESVVIDVGAKELQDFQGFIQAMFNRRFVGSLRYGKKATSRQKYMTRLGKELAAYRREGNLEQLFNIAVYAALESMAPENKKFHFNTTVDSVTRGEMGV
jgi:hypothetical protein